MSTRATLRHRLTARRQRAEFHRILRQADPRLRDELITLSQRDQRWS